MPTWIRGHEFQYPPYEITKQQLLEWIKAGKIVPYEDEPQTLYPDPAEPRGLRRIMPTPDFEQSRGRLAFVRYEFKWRQDWLARYDNEHMTKDSALRERRPDMIPEDLSLKRPKLEKELAELKGEMTALEAELNPVAVWSIFENLPIARQERLTKLAFSELAAYSQEEIVALLQPHGFEFDGSQAVSFDDLWEKHRIPAYEAFQSLKNGLIVPYCPDTGSVIPCPYEHHEHHHKSERHAEISQRLNNLRRVADSMHAAEKWQELEQVQNEEDELKLEQQRIKADLEALVAAEPDLENRQYNDWCLSWQYLHVPEMKEESQSLQKILRDNNAVFPLAHVKRLADEVIGERQQREFGRGYKNEPPVPKFDFARWQATHGTKHNSQEIPADTRQVKRRTSKQLMWEKVVIIAQELLAKDPEVTLVQIAESNEVNKCFPSDKPAPSIETIIKRLQGKVRTKRGRRKEK
jgi:hypothetical protein